MLACSERKLNRPATSWAALPCGSNSCGVCPKGWCVLVGFRAGNMDGRDWYVEPIRVPCGVVRRTAPGDRDGHYGVFFAAHHIATINLTNNQSVSDVSEQTSVMSPG
ncbi:hypothetical protein BWO90_06435 (plasmid) [Sinorhizobium meliloti]|nr:hypothetical protein BWO76_07245 [Sinorhizobium meliloti]ATB01767.1 hypothetical protein BWO90_06435 [Sinorhizobium meliloti]